MRTLSTRASFWTAASVAALALWSSGAPSIVYPLYEADWNLTPVIITSIFAVYPIVLVVIMLVFGGISDYIGRRLTLLAGVAAIIVGVVVFALAPDVTWLFIGRAFQGIGVGLAMGPASAALVEFTPGRNAARASSINSAATMVGLALSTIVGGALVQYAPWPRELSFWALLIVAVGVFVAVWLLPRHVREAEAVGHWRPRPLVVPRALRGVVTASAFSITTGFAIGAVLLSLGAQIAKDLLHTENALVAGSVLAIISVAAGIVSLTARRIPPHMTVAIGGVVAAVGVSLLVLSASLASLAVFVVTSVVAGVAYGLLFMGGLGLISANAPAHHRASTFSSVYLIAYLAQGIVAVAVGIVATGLGLRVALDISGPVLVLLALATTVFALTMGRMPRVAVTDASPEFVMAGK